MCVSLIGKKKEENLFCHFDVSSFHEVMEKDKFIFLKSRVMAVGGDDVDANT
jgi:hypothetical protein